MSDDKTRELFVIGPKNAHAMKNQALSIMKPQVGRIESTSKLNDGADTEASGSRLGSTVLGSGCRGNVAGRGRGISILLAAEPERHASVAQSGTTWQPMKSGQTPSEKGECNEGRYFFRR